MTAFQPHIFIPVLAGAITVFGSILIIACLACVDLRVRK
jgi:hypothetical protein